jgi:arabinogalactan oligomer / maltooligosaccharide transport system permease protein
MSNNDVYHKKQSNHHVGNAIAYTVLIVLCVIWVIPIVWVILISFSQNLSGIPSYFMPKYGYTFQNYISLFANSGIQSGFYFPRWFFNTFIVSCCSCLISTFFVLCVSYALSRMRFRFRKPFMNIALILGMFPGFMSMIAVYYILKAFNLTDSLLSLILVYSGGAGAGFYIVKGFFDTTPKTIDEAAMIDGAKRSQIFWKLTIPMSKPIIVYTILTSFMAPWMDFIFVNMIIGPTSYQNYTVALGLFHMIDKEHIKDYFGMFAAGSVLVSIPLSILFVALQGFYVEGVAGGSVKG